MPTQLQLGCGRLSELGGIYEASTPLLQKLGASLLQLLPLVGPQVSLIGQGHWCWHAWLPAKRALRAGHNSDGVCSKLQSPALEEWQVMKAVVRHSVPLLLSFLGLSTPLLLLLSSRPALHHSTPWGGGLACAKQQGRKQKDVCQFVL